MPLHDWNETSGWEGLHLLWMTELLRRIKEDLPPGFRAYLGSGPALAIGAPPARPDVSVRAVADPGGITTVPSSSANFSTQPDVEVAVAALESEPAVLVERAGRLIAAVELISPRNKDRPLSRTNYGRRYASYLMDGVHLLLVDVHARPAGFSFADQIALELHAPNQLPLPTPMAVSYRVGEPAPSGGKFLAVWRHPLVVGTSLGLATLPLDVDRAVRVDLETTYMRAAKDAYLS